MSRRKSFLRATPVVAIVGSSVLLGACGGGAGIEADDAMNRESLLASGESVSWEVVAREHQSFVVTGTRVARYGSGSRWIEKTVSGTVPCTSGFFGSDPAPGVLKECGLRSVAAAPAPAASWVKVADEHQGFTVGSSVVRYGSGSRWVEKSVAGEGRCTNAFFGTDPAPGVLKRCDAWTASASPAPAPAPAPVSSGTYSAPIVISRGGTYSGNWESADPKIPAVTITTVQPVVIQNCRLRGKGHLISSLQSGSNVTVRNCVGQGLNPGVVNGRTGRFVNLYKPNSVTVERNTLLSTAGIYVDGAGAAASGGIAVRYNVARNIEGRLSNGAGGYLTTFTAVQFAQLNGVRATKNVEIAWNEVINEPGRSRVEENINLFLTSGTADSPILISNNYIQGAYAGDPISSSYSGGGIIVDGSSSSMSTASGHIRIRDNQLVGTSNHGVALAAGHNIDIRNNRLIGSGRLPDGRRIGSANVGIYVINIYRVSGTFFNHTVTGNTIGWHNASGAMNNVWIPDCAGSSCQGNQLLAGPITNAMESAEWSSWKSKLSARGISVGSSVGN
jgi:hypothetical protein